MTDRDVLWITLESLRYDHTSMSGHERDTTPTLSRLAVEGDSFDSCHSHDIWTRSSSASILTGLAASAHRTWSNEAKLPVEVTTIPETFRDAGYHTACISPNANLTSGTGLSRGFEDFHYLSKSTLLEASGLRSLLRWALNLRHHSGGLTRDGNQHCLGYLSNQIAKRHIDRAADGDGPLFLYQHHGDSHHAYVPPIEWRDRFADDLPMPVDDAIDLALEMSRNLHRYVAEDDPFTDEEWQTLRVLYDTAVAYVDDQVDGLVSYAQHRLDDPIVVVTGDHGEFFGEHGLLAHMLSTDTAVSNVPLVVTGLDGLPHGGLVQHADVMEMICSDLGIDHAVPVGRDVRTHPREFTVTQRGGTRTRHILDLVHEHNAAFPDDAFHTDDLTSVQTEHWRYQSSGARSELFELPDQTTDVEAEHEAVTERLDDRLQRWLEEFGQPVGTSGEAEFDAGMQDQLRDLGYL